MPTGCSRAAPVGDGDRCVRLMPTSSARRAVVTSLHTRCSTRRRIIAVTMGECLRRRNGGDRGSAGVNYVDVSAPPPPGRRVPKSWPGSRVHRRPRPCSRRIPVPSARKKAGSADAAPLKRAGGGRSCRTEHHDRKISSSAPPGCRAGRAERRMIEDMLANVHGVVGRHMQARAARSRSISSESTRALLATPSRVVETPGFCGHCTSRGPRPRRPRGCSGVRERGEGQSDSDGSRRTARYLGERRAPASGRKRPPIGTRGVTMTSRRGRGRGALRLRAKELAKMTRQASRSKRISTSLPEINSHDCETRARLATSRRGSRRTPRGLTARRGNRWSSARPRAR